MINARTINLFEIYCVTFLPSDTEFSRCNHSQEILVGPLKSIPEHPNGNGPQDMKLKETGGYRRTECKNLFI